jgi:hypothetical protein
MAEFRQTHCKMWTDGWFIELELDEKLLWSYYFTNEHTTVTGIYEIPMRVMAFETGINRERVEQILQKFVTAQKCRYEDGVLWVFNMPKYQGLEGKKISPKLLVRIRKDVAMLPETQIKRDFIKDCGALYGIDTLSIPFPESASDTDTDTDTETETETETERETEKAQKPKPALFSIKDAEKIYCEITQYPTTSPGMYPYLEKILDMLQKLGALRTTKRLKDAWEGWCQSKNKRGLPYSRTNPAWIDYAIAGQVPRGDQTQASPTHKSYAAEFAEEIVHGKHH